MKRTLLLCFIHGFKVTKAAGFVPTVFAYRMGQGGDDTFGNFPQELQARLSHDLPKIDVREIVYPKYETRGDLAECVGRFRDWLLEKVIDIEISKHTQSPTVDPSVHTILIGHSMGGIVAADTLLALTSDRPISGSSDSNNVTNTLMFPYIQGVLAFDTPYLGISSGVAAHPLEEHYKTASAAITQLSGLSGMIWGGSAAAATDPESGKAGEKNKKAESSSAPPAEAAAAPAWQRWGKIAMYAGAAGAVAAGGAAAYIKRDQITEGWSWVGSHLEFVGCLMRGEDLKKRMSGVIKLNKEMGIGFADIYTRLGKKAQNQEGNMVGSVVGNQRTFCNLPKKDAIVYFHEAINDAASDETSAHMTMFSPKDNPGYSAMSQEAENLIVSWTMSEWYSRTEDTEVPKD